MTSFPPPRRLTVVTDEQCELCRRCRGWLADQPLLVEVQFLPVGSDEAVRRYGSIGIRRDVLIVADEHGRIWAGPTPSSCACGRRPPTGIGPTWLPDRVGGPWPGWCSARSRRTATASPS